MEYLTNEKLPTAHPSSARHALVPISDNNGTGGTVNASRYDRCVLGSQMRAANTLSTEKLPDFIFNAVYECEDPKHQAITSNDVTAVLAAYEKYMVVKHGVIGGDAALRLHHGHLLKARLPHLCDNGKGAPGATRSWHKMLKERKRNSQRKSTKVSAGPHCPHCPHVPTSQAAPHARCQHARATTLLGPAHW